MEVGISHTQRPFYLSFIQEDILLIFANFYIFLQLWSSWLTGGEIGHNSDRSPNKDHSTKNWLKLAISVVSEELIKMLKANNDDWRTTEDDGRSVVAKAHMTLWVRSAKTKIKKKGFSKLCIKLLKS